MIWVLGTAMLLGLQGSAAPAPKVAPMMDLAQGQTKKVTCPSCKKLVAQGKFCTSCGKPLKQTKSEPPTPPPSALVECPTCGTRGPKSRFCSKCGHDFEREKTLGEVRVRLSGAWSDYHTAAYGEALAKLDEALRQRLTGQSEEFCEAHTLRALCLIRLDRLAEADRALVAAAAHPAPKASALSIGIAFYFAPARVTEAQRWFELAQEHDPKNPNVLEWLGDYYQHRASDPAKAEAHYLRAIEMDNHTGNPHWALARMLRDQGKFKEAIAQLEEAIANHDPTSTAYRNELGYALYRNGEYGRAEEALRESIRHEETSTARLYLAYTFEAKGDLDAAEAAYQRSLELSNDIMALCEYGQFLSIRRQKPAEAEAKMREALKINPKFAHGYKRLIQMFERDGKPESAAAVRTEAANNGVKLD